MSDQEQDLDARQQPDEAHHLDAFKGEVQRDLESFKKLHGRAFLLLRRATGPVALRAPTRPTKTLVTNVDDDEDESRELSPAEYLVFPIRKTERSIIARFYSVGQTRNNDIVLRDVTVSKFHAFFQDSEDGEGFVLQDARSTNGTFVNDERVPQQGAGEPVRVSTGDVIRFGGVELSFLHASELCSLVRSVSSMMARRK
jgi:pSer/pThr/pTyr-binding forkhead associated (FHA) protein